MTHLVLPKDRIQDIKMNILFYHTNPKVAPNARHMFREPAHIKFCFLDTVRQVIHVNLVTVLHKGLLEGPAVLKKNVL